MEEQEALEVGFYCQELLQDARFIKLVNLCETNMSLEMLSAETLEEREKTHRTYQGLKELLNVCKQFVLVKDQLVANKDIEESE